MGSGFEFSTKICLWTTETGRADFSSETVMQEIDRCLDCLFVLARVVGKDWTRSVSTWMSSSCGDKGILNRQQSCGMTGRTHGEKNSFTKGMVMPWWEVSCPQPRLGKRRKKLWLSEPEKDLEQEKKRLLPAKTWKQALLFCRNPMTLKHYILLD